MSLSQALLPELQHEMATTRRLLERVPEDRLDWQPHPKSMTLGRLASHLAEIPGWMRPSVKQDALDLNPPGGEPYVPAKLSSRDEMLALFDQNVADAADALASTPDEVFFTHWTMLNGGKEVFTLPKVAVVRSFVLSHTIHHRAQLGVFLRLLDIPVPATYGPSADEGGM